MSMLYLGGLFMIKIKHTIILVLIIFFSHLVSAETTFFDQDNFFIMGESATGGVIEGKNGETTYEGGCRYEWDCTDWSKCLSSGKQTRICTNTGTCSNTYKTPEIEQNCTYIIAKVNGSDKEDSEKKSSDEDEINDFSEKIPTNWNYLWLFTIILLFCLGCICIFKYRKKMKNLMNGLGRKYDNNSIKWLINKKIYTDEGYHIGNVEEVILHHDKIHSLRVILDKRYKFVTKGVIIKYRDVKSIGKIVIVDGTILGHLRKFKN